MVCEWNTKVISEHLSVIGGPLPMKLQRLGDPADSCFEEETEVLIFRHCQYVKVCSDG